MGMRDKRRYFGRDPRALTEDDVYSWMRAASSQKRRPTRDDLRRHMHDKNIVRWYRLRRDYRWLQREMVKLGLNPEEAYCLL